MQPLQNQPVQAVQVTLVHKCVGGGSPKEQPSIPKHACSTTPLQDDHQKAMPQREAQWPQAAASDVLSAAQAAGS